MGEWLGLSNAPENHAVLLLMGETIPGTPDVRVGTFCTGPQAEEMGYREYAKYGGWLIWNDGSDFYVIDVSEPFGWASIPVRELLHHAPSD